MRSEVLAHGDPRGSMGRIRRKRTRDNSSPVTDGLVSYVEYAQLAAELSRRSGLRPPVRQESMSSSE